MTNEELIQKLSVIAADLEKAQMRGIKAQHKSLLIFTAYRYANYLITQLTEGESNEEK